jgi:hypothetical protein
MLGHTDAVLLLAAAARLPLTVGDEEGDRLGIEDSCCCEDLPASVEVTDARSVMLPLMLL